MNKNEIKCLVYRYRRAAKERLCAVVIKGTQPIPLNEIDYKAEEPFFLTSEFAKFIGYIQGCFLNLCVISQTEAQGEEFVEFCEKYYDYDDFDNTVWTAEDMRKALSSLDLKGSLVVEDMVISGKGGGPTVGAAVYAKNKKEGITFGDEEEKEVLEELNLLEDSNDNDKNTIAMDSRTGDEKNANKTKLSLAMDKIIDETYNI